MRGDDPVARELVAAMEAWVTENFGPTTPDRTSTVALEEMAPPSARSWWCTRTARRWPAAGCGGWTTAWPRSSACSCSPPARGRGHGRRVLAALEAVAAELGYRRLRLDTAQSLTTAIALYRAAGYRDIPDYNGNRYASFWGEKVLARSRNVNCGWVGRLRSRPRRSVSR